MFTGQDKMCRLLTEEPQALQLINRFGLPLGVEEKSIRDVCESHGIDCDTFLNVVNFAIDKTPPPVGSVSHIPTLMTYIRNGHTYFMDFLIPRIRQELIEAVSQNHTDSRIPMLIIRFYDEYVEELKKHIAHENKNAFHLHNEDDKHVAKKLSELKNLIIKYYPNEANDANDARCTIYSALQDIFQIEQEMALHCAIEDHILLPALNKSNNDTPEAEELSDREKEVLVELVNGKSNKEIADTLCISTYTVISHRKNIARKLNIHSTAGLTIYAIVNQLVCLDELKNT